jgi:prepilin-type N-terminal cleavage/methylation domain-containing protein
MMNKPFRGRPAAGFTLIELLIVVIIIAILAAIAIPQFANTTGDAQESTLDANLNTMRSAVELYRIQHNNVLPAVAASSGGAAACTTAGGTLGAGAANSEAAFKDQLTQYSDGQGHTCTITATGFIYGPYLRAIPADSISNPAKTTVALVSAATVAVPADTTGGWRFNTATGRLEMNSNALDRRGNNYYTH